VTVRKGGDAAFIAARAAGASVAAAARAAGVSERTAYRWLEDGDIRTRLDAARAEIVARAVDKLSAASVEAADTLRRLLYSDMDFARLAAARTILELGAKLREQQDLVSRIEALEEQLTKGDPAWRPRTA
jgi:transposase